MAGVCAYSRIRIAVHVPAIAQPDEDDHAAGRHCCRVRCLVGNGCFADVDGKKIFSIIMELCMEAGPIEPVPAEQPDIFNGDGDRIWYSFHLYTVSCAIVA